MSERREPNTIRAVVRTLDGGLAVVEVEHGGCGRCHEEGGCGGQQLTQMFCSGSKTYRVDNRIGAQVGDRVNISIAAGSVRRAANLAYGVPLFALVTGAILGTAGGNEGAVLGGGLGLVLSFAYVRFRSFSVGKSAAHPHIVSRS